MATPPTAGPEPVATPPTEERRALKKRLLEKNRNSLVTFQGDLDPITIFPEEVFETTQQIVMLRQFSIISNILIIILSFSFGGS